MYDNSKKIASQHAAGVGTAVALMAFAMPVQAAVSLDAVSLNWKQFAGGVNDVLDGYGVQAADNWLNLTSSNTGSDLTLSSGGASSIDLSGTTPGGYDTWNFGALNNTPMRAGISTFGTGSQVTLSDLNATFASYDVIVYAAGFNGAAGGNQGAISDGSTTYYYTVPNPFTTTLIQSTDTNIVDGADQGNYVRFDGLSSDSLTITIDSINSGVGIGGIQIVGERVPEPASVTILLAAAGLTGWRRRR